ncbi:MAG: RsmE family RNA methyltransferase [Spirochaetota bacterium]
MNLLLLEPGERVLEKTDARSQHIRRVLRLREGDTLRAGELGGSIGTATVTGITADRLTLAFEPYASPPPLPPVELLLGHPRPIVLRRMLRDLTALGPRRIVVAPTELGEKSYHESNLWDDVETPMREGAAQGGSTLLPELVRGWTLERAIDELTAGPGARIVLHAERDDPSGSPPGLLDLLAGASRAAPVAIAVGSERGWTAREVDLLRAAGFVAASLGSRTLRTETAATVAMWAAISWYHRLP